LHDLIPAAHKSDTVVIGLSPDTPDKMSELAGKVSAKTGRPMSITLLADPDHKVIDAYGLRNMEAAKMGRYLPHPTTYVIDAGGTVRWKFTEVNYRIRPSNSMILSELGKIW